MKAMQKYLALILLSVCGSYITAQTEGVSIKTTIGPPHPSAMLDVESSSKGLLIPRVSLAGISNNTSPIASPANGLLVFNTNGSLIGGTGFYYWDNSNTQWTKIGTSSGSGLWSLIGSGPDIYYGAGKVRIGANTPTPVYQLELLKSSESKIFRMQGQYGEFLFNSATSVIPGISIAVALSTNSGTTPPPVNIRPDYAGMYSCYICSTHTLTESVLTHSIDATTDIGKIIQRFSPTDEGISLNSSKNGGASYIKGGTNRLLFINSESSLSLSAASGVAIRGRSMNVFTSNPIVFGISNAIYAFTSNGNIVIGSDSTLKTNITPETNVLGSILECKPVKYNMKTEPNTPKQHGLIAQQLAAVFPELVTTVQTGMGETDPTVKTVNYIGLISVLIKGMQEQQAIIDDLKSRIEVLEGH